MTRRKREIPTPPAILRLPNNKPHVVKRGVVVQIRDNQGKLMNRRGIVMAITKESAYSRAYGPEFYVCEVSSPAGTAMVVRDAIKSGNKAEIKRVVEASAIILEKNRTLLQPVGRVKKIPQVCTYAMKIEKGKL